MEIVALACSLLAICGGFWVLRHELKQERAENARLNALLALTQAKPVTFPLGEKLALIDKITELERILESIKDWKLYKGIKNDNSIQPKVIIVVGRDMKDAERLIAEKYDIQSYDLERLQTINPKILYEDMY